MSGFLSFVLRLLMFVLCIDFILFSFLLISALLTLIPLGDWIVLFC